MPTLEPIDGGKTTDHWTSKLKLAPTKPPRPLSTLENCVTALHSAPEWEGALCYNEFTDQLIQKRTPWSPMSEGKQWTDNDDRRAACWFQHWGINVSVGTATDAIRIVAHEHVINPLIDFLNGLEWDGTPRVHDWLTWYLGVEDTAYSRAVGQAWLISAVARAWHPGCQADCCLILEGAQGIGKSSALRALAGPELYSDALGTDLAGKEASILCTGTWIVELSELESLNRTEVGAIKSFLSRRIDHYRPPYARHAIRIPRQCVFAGTTNSWQYLRDETGGRRFWPVRCTEIHPDHIERDRNNLWGEAVKLFLDGTPWYIPKDLENLVERQQEERYEPNEWQEPVEEIVRSRPDISISEVLISLGKPVSEWTQKDRTRVRTCLLSLGFQQYRVAGGSRLRRYRRDSKRP
jgi:predicted P-loop ATPase